MMVYVNLVLGAVIIGFFFVGRKTAKPTKLNMKAKSNSSQLVLEPEKQNPLPSHTTAVAVSDADRSLTKLESTAAAPTEIQRLSQERALGVLFMYNGHDWEAHQVLGLPQGASMHQITVTYQELIKKSDPSTFEFFEAAYTALSQKHKKHRL